MSFYGELADTTRGLLAKFGTSIVILRAGTAPDPVVGLNGASGAVVTTTGVLRNYPDRLVDGSRIQTGDCELVLTDEVVPVLSDRIQINGQYWNVVSVKVSSPAGTPLCYYVQVRK